MDLKDGDLNHITDGPGGMQGRPDDDPYMGDENTY